MKVIRISDESYQCLSSVKSDIQKNRKDYVGFADALDHILKGLKLWEFVGFQTHPGPP